MIKALAVAAALLITLTACSTGSVHAEDQVLTAPASSPAVIAIPDAVSLAAARAEYLKVVAPRNADYARFAAVADDQDVSHWVEVCAQIATDDQAFIDALTSYRWPHAAIGTAAALAAVLQPERQDFHDCSTAPSLYLAQLVTSNLPDPTPQARAMRNALGLPPPPK